MAKKLFSLLAVFALLFTSCDALTEEPTGKFHFTSEATLNASSIAGCLSVSYAIDEAVEGAKITTSYTADWFEVKIDETFCRIDVCVEDNNGAARTDIVTVEYAGDKATITVNQEGAEE